MPKGHQFAHMLAFMWMFAPVDAARLNNFAHDHIKNVKDAPKQTRGHERTMLEELKAVVDRLDAVKTQLAGECGPPSATALHQIYPPVMSACNNVAVISALFLKADITVQNYNAWHAPGVSVCMLTHHAQWGATCAVRWTALHRASAGQPRHLRANTSIS